jgi:Yip1 domain
MPRIAGVLRHPRSTMAALVAAPAFLATWALLLILWLAPATWLLSTDIGRQALVDERVRVVEAFGGQIGEAAYARLQQSPPWLTYFTSGGRLLLTPPLTVLVALGLVGLARADGGGLSFLAAMAVSVHASTVLVLQELVATPLHYQRESITSHTNLAVLFPGFGDGTLPARLLGSIELFGLWWLWLLALGVAAATRRPARRYFGRLLVVYVGVAALLAAVVTVAGGS